MWRLLFKASSVKGGSVNSMEVRLGSDWVWGNFDIILSNLDLSQEVLELHGLIFSVIPLVSGSDQI